MENAAEARTQSGWDRLRFLTSELRLTIQLLATGDLLHPGVASPQLLALLGSYINEAINLRRTGQLQETDAASELVLRDYRAILEHLDHILPKLERQLRDDRTRLAQEQNRLNLASDWTSTSRLTR